MEGKTRFVPPGREINISTDLGANWTAACNIPNNILKPDKKMITVLDDMGKQRYFAVKVSPTP